MNKLSKQHFWEWFSRHNHEYLALQNKTRKEATYWLNELSAHLRACSRFLGFSLEWKNQTGLLTITVNGRLRYFKNADDLVAKAPAIPGWTIISLEEPRPIDFLLEQQVEASGIDPRDLYFSFEDQDNRVLNVYHLLCTPENEDIIYQFATAALYNLLGERSFGTDIRSLQVKNLSCSGGDEVYELEVIASYLGLRASGMVVDRYGKLAGA